MRRRQFIAGLGSAAAWPLTARAQQRGIPVIGYLFTGREPRSEQSFVAAFRGGLRETGFLEGRNVSIEYRFANNHLGLLSEFVADLVRRDVNVIVATSTAAVLPAKAATNRIPIIFLSRGDLLSMVLSRASSSPVATLPE